MLVSVLYFRYSQHCSAYRYRLYAAIRNCFVQQYHGCLCSCSHHRLLTLGFIAVKIIAIRDWLHLSPYRCNCSLLEECWRSCAQYDFGRSRLVPGSYSCYLNSLSLVLVLELNFSVRLRLHSKVHPCFSLLHSHSKLLLQ